MSDQIDLFERPPQTTVVHCREKKYDIYIGRGEGSIWGNPFTHKEGTLAAFKVATRKEAIEKYREWILTQPHLLEKIPELKGKVLGCWCRSIKNSKACHGDVLAEMANKISTREMLNERFKGRKGKGSILDSEFIAPHCSED